MVPVMYGEESVSIIPTSSRAFCLLASDIGICML